MYSGFSFFLYSESVQEEVMEERQYRGPLTQEELREVFAEIRMP